ncbi:hypothetical protein GOBAR_AA16731 [Gossypium barbadense]|uniref:Uncharacterized protein n=1 Tax=Gossypium barbadense TaxID=3634 RepID=A0A2P5XKP9_GOSBA|nr:hypothetical protein GOBAR_AA16731 [Gossypium barbadense]
MELCSTFHLQTVMARFDDPGSIQFCLGGLVCQLNVPEFETTLGLYTNKFMEENELHALNRHIHHSPSRCWNALMPDVASYNPSCSKASALPPSLRYLHAILAHTLTGRLLNIAAQSSSLTLMGQMSPQGISSMLSMRMIKKQLGTFPPQYHLTQSAKEGDPEDIIDDVPPHHEDPPSQLAPPSHPRAPKLTITQELETPLGKVLHNCHVLLDHDHSYHQI